MYSLFLNEIRHLGQNLFYLNPTPADGNCWYSAVIDNIQNRPEILQSIPNELQFALDSPENLRIAVVNFLENEYISGSNDTLMNFFGQYDTDAEIYNFFVLE